MKPAPPPKPPLERTASPTWAGYALLVLLLVGGIAGLVLVSFGSVCSVVLLAAVVLPIVALTHYLLWGWWLGKAIRDAGERQPWGAAWPHFGDGAHAGGELGDSWPDGGGDDS